MWGVPEKTGSWEEVPPWRPPIMQHCSTSCHIEGEMPGYVVVTLVLKAQVAPSAELPGPYSSLPGTEQSNEYCFFSVAIKIVHYTLRIRITKQIWGNYGEATLSYIRCKHNLEIAILGVGGCPCTPVFLAHCFVSLKDAAITAFSKQSSITTTLSKCIMAPGVFCLMRHKWDHNFIKDQQRSNTRHGTSKLLPQVHRKLLLDHK